MNNSQNSDDESRRDTQCSSAFRCDPPDWLSTDQLETELFNAIMEDTPSSTEEDIDNYDDDFDALLYGDDDEESEEEHRRSTFRLLVGMRPTLGELLGGPPAYEKNPTV